MDVVDGGGPSKLERLRIRAKTDLLWLGNEVLGYDFQENPHRGLFNCFLQKGLCGNPDCDHPEIFHLVSTGANVCCSSPGCGCTKYVAKTLPQLDREIKRRLTLWQRGAFKTSAMAVEMLQLILNFPDIRILILAGNIPESKVRLEEVKGHFENWGKDGKLQKLFPEFCSPVQFRKMGNSSRFITPARVHKNLRQPTLAVASPKTLKTGQHYDVIVVDDLVNELNSKKPEQLQKSIDDYKSVVPVLEPEGYIYVLGTRYSFDDAYGWIQEQIKNEGLNNWLVSLRTCWITRCKHPACDHPDIRHIDGGGPCNVEGCECNGFESNGVRECLFPQVTLESGKTIGFTPEILDKLLKELGPETFGCQYENNPLAGAQKKFTRAMIQTHLLPMSRIPGRGPVVIQVDIAESPNPDADDMVIYVSRIAGGRHHLIDCASGHIPVDQQPIVICDLILKYGPRAVYIEKKTGARYLERLIQLEAMRRHIKFLPIELQNADNTEGAKDMRIGALLGYFAQDRIKIFAGLPNLEKLITQLTLWPKSQRRDDHADCLALLLQSPTGFENVPLPPPELPFWLREQKREAAGDMGDEGNGLPFGING